MAMYRTHKPWMSLIKLQSAVKGYTLNLIHLIGGGFYGDVDL